MGEVEMEEISTSEDFSPGNLHSGDIWLAETRKRQVYTPPNLNFIFMKFRFS